MHQSTRAAARQFPGKYLLKKYYPSRRIYDCVRAAYIKRLDVLELVIRGEDVVVVDNENNDVTRYVLFDTLGLIEEFNPEPLLKVDDLVRMIRDSGSRISSEKLHKLQSGGNTNPSRSATPA